MLGNKMAYWVQTRYPDADLQEWALNTDGPTTNAILVKYKEKHEARQAQKRAATSETRQPTKKKEISQQTTTNNQTSNAFASQKRHPRNWKWLDTMCGVGLHAA